MRLRPLAFLLVLALAGVACGNSEPESAPAVESPSSAAAGLRATMDRLFREHVYLAALMSEDALAKQTKGYEGAADAFEASAREIAALFKGVYGESAQKSFLEAWNAYEQLLVSYPVFVAAGRKVQPVEVGFRGFQRDMGLFAARLTPVLTGRAMAAAARDVISQLEAVFVWQAKKDFVKAGANLRAASDRAGSFAAPFVSAMVDDVPASYPGDPLSPPAELRVSLAAYMLEDIYLIGINTEELITARTAQVKGTQATLDAGAAALAKALGHYYGTETEKAFLPIWKSHAQLYRNYATTGKDKTKHADALSALQKYATDFGTFIAKGNAGIDASSVTLVLSRQVADLKAVIDLQLRGDYSGAAKALRTAADHIGELARIIAEATVARFPKKFLV